MKFVQIVGSLAALASVSFWPSAMAQRVQFATPVAPQATPANTAPSTTFAQPSTASPYLPSTSTSTAPNATLGSPTTTAPQTIYTPPGATTIAPPATAPGAAVGAPAPTWDPYATPSNAPSPLLSNDPYLAGAGPTFSAVTMQKFLQHVDLDYHWFAGHNGSDNHKSLGINDVELSATFGFPLFQNPETPLLITPGFAVHYWEGPVSVYPLSPDDPAPADLPPRTYDAYLDAAWNPRLNSWFSGELDVRVGVYSDFKRVASDSFRYTGKGLGVVQISPSVKMKLGIWYLDRNRVKILPAGGLVWTPNADVYFNILFPDPKVARRLGTWGTTEWWIYGSGEYGGGTWAIKRQNGLPPNPYYPDTNGTYTTFDYNDIRVALGLEFTTLRRLHGMFEVGGAFGRELVYEDDLPPTYKPDSTVYLRAGLAY